MKGNQQIIDTLNQLLAAELTAMDVYFLHSRMCEDWGFQALADRFAHEFEDEKGHAGRIVERILFLEGAPNLVDRYGFTVGTNVEEVLRNDLALEHDVARNLNAAIKLARDLGDNATRGLLADLLRDTEDDHIFWLESQIHLIETVGLQNYLAEQIRPGKVPAH